MTTANISINPYATTNAAGTFNISSGGLIQGTAFDSPNARFNLAGGYLASTETIPMWGGVAISENIGSLAAYSPTTPNPVLGSSIIRATNVTAATAGQITGWSVFDQNYAWVNSPSSPVPMGGTGQSVHFYRVGSGARIALAIDPTLVTLDGGIITQQVSWDYGLQRLAPYVAAYSANVITAATWASTNGGQATLTTTSAHGVTVGSDFTITGVTPPAYNGTFKAITGTTGSTLVYALPLTSTPGSGTAFGTLVAGGGAAPVQQIIKVETGVSMTVNYNPATNLATWNYSGSCAVVII